MVSAPSSGVSLVVAPLMASQGMQAVILATIIMGLIQIIFGYCHTNKLLDYIPTGVVIGFMNALEYYYSHPNLIIYFKFLMLLMFLY